MRTAAHSLLLIVVVVAPLQATEQMSERLIYRGETGPIENVYPLEYLFEEDDRPKVFRMVSTALYRGYVGTWRIDKGKLHLVKLGVPDWKENDDGELEQTWEDIPVEKVMPRKKLPVFADWFTGLLVTGRGKPDYENVRLGFHSYHNAVAVFWIDQGVVKKSSEVTRKEASPFRSFDDLVWTSLDKSVKDTGNWIDARLLSTSQVDAHIKAKRPITTRGKFSAYKKTKLLIPSTPRTDWSEITLQVKKGTEQLQYGDHIEVTGMLHRRGKELTIDVRKIRRLKPGETIHAASYPQWHKQQHGDGKAK